MPETVLEVLLDAGMRSCKRCTWLRMVSEQSLRDKGLS